MAETCRAALVLSELFGLFASFDAEFEDLELLDADDELDNDEEDAALNVLKALLSEEELLDADVGFFGPSDGLRLSPLTAFFSTPVFSWDSRKAFLTSSWIAVGQLSLFQSLESN